MEGYQELLEVVFQVSMTNERNVVSSLPTLSKVLRSTRALSLTLLSKDCSPRKEEESWDDSKVHDSRSS